MEDFMITRRGLFSLGAAAVTSMVFAAAGTKEAAAQAFLPPEGRLADAHHGADVHPANHRFHRLLRGRGPRRFGFRRRPYRGFRRDLHGGLRPGFRRRLRRRYFGHH